MSNGESIKLTYELPYARMRKLGRKANRKIFGDIQIIFLAWTLVFVLLFLSMEFWPTYAYKALSAITESLGLPPESSTLLIYIILFLYLLGFALLIWATRRRVQKHVDFHDSVTLTTQDSGVCIETSSIAHLLKWKGIDEIFIEPDGPVLRSGVFFFLIPNKAFAGDAQRSAFLSNVLRHIGPDARERSERNLANVLQQ